MFSTTTSKPPVPGRGISGKGRPARVSAILADPILFYLYAPSLLSLEERKNYR
jgi:hypothetical protein